MKASGRLPINEIRKAVSLGDSYERLGLMFDFVGRVPRHQWIRLLGKEWSGFDNVGHYLCHLAVELPDGTEPEMMTKAEREALSALPEVVTVYRGCGNVNRNGCCWSLDWDVAARFPTLMRYRVSDPMLVTATVRRDEIIALKLDRNESEVITFDAIEVDTELLVEGMRP
jgi:hypothetical protein